MSQPARLAGTLLARKGQACPAGARAHAGIASPPPLPPATPRSARPRRADNVRSLETAATTAAGRKDQPDAGKAGRVTLTVKLDPARRARLKILAAREQRTSQDLMIEALDALLEARGPACACMRSGSACNPRNCPPGPAPRRPVPRGAVGRDTNPSDPRGRRHEPAPARPCSSARDP